MEAREIRDFLLLPIRVYEAAARGVGRMVMEHLKDSAFAGNPYIEMTPEQRQSIQQEDLTR